MSVVHGHSGESPVGGGEDPRTPSASLAVEAMGQVFQLCELRRRLRFETVKFQESSEGEKALKANEEETALPHAVLRSYATPSQEQKALKA